MDLVAADGDGADATVDQQRLVTEAERLLATLDGLTMHALLQPEWMTAQMCHDVLEAHLEGLGRLALQPLTCANFRNRLGHVRLAKGGNWMHHTGGPGWRITMDTSGPMLIALYVRDAAGLDSAGHPALSHAAPKIRPADHSHLIAEVGGVSALKTEWEAWWEQLLKAHPRDVAGTLPAGLRPSATPRRSGACCRPISAPP